MSTAKITLWMALFALVGCGDSVRVESLEQGAAGGLPGPPPGYKLVWGDEFEGNVVDRTKWGFPSYKEREGQLMNTPGTAMVREGCLELHTVGREGKLHGAVLDSKHSKRFVYGYFEARIKFQRLRGHHGCFWLQSPSIRSGDKEPQRAGTEMNIVEWFGAGRRQGWAGMNVYYASGGQIVRSPTEPKFERMGGLDPAAPERPLGDLSTEFHLYALLWTKDQLTFFCDGKVIMEDRQAVSQVGEYLVLSLLSAEWERDLLRLAELPDPLYVDYVRVYQAVK
jgi:beta-glucanase (GH16 family)